MIEGRVNGQHLELSFDVVVSDSVKYLTIKFICDDSWDGAKRKAVFTLGEDSYAVILDKDNPECTDENTCIVPFEVIHTPGFTVGLIGTEGDKVITTLPCFVPVLKSGELDGAEPNDPTPDQYAQIIEICAAAQQAAASVRADADNGLFKGEKGEKGDKGDKGDKGENNPAYTDYEKLRNECREAADDANKAAEDASKVRSDIEAGGFIESIKEQNKGGKFRVWSGTQAEYDAIPVKINGCLYIIEDDASLDEQIQEINERCDGIEYDLKGIVVPADYIVEQGIIHTQNGSWKYEKWKSGTIKAYIKEACENLSFEPAGSIYRCVDKKFPIPAVLGIKEIHTIIPQVNGAYYPAWGGQGYVSGDNTFICVDVFTPAVETVADFATNFYIEITGIWNNGGKQ